MREVAGVVAGCDPKKRAGKLLGKTWCLEARWKWVSILWIPMARVVQPMHIPARGSSFTAGIGIYFCYLFFPIFILCVGNGVGKEKSPYMQLACKGLKFMEPAVRIELTTY